MNDSRTELDMEERDPLLDNPLTMLACGGAAFTSPAWCQALAEWLGAALPWWAWVAAIGAGAVAFLVWWGRLQ